MKYVLTLILLILLTSCATKPTIRTDIFLHHKYTNITYSVRNVPHFNDTTILQLLKITDERKIDSISNKQIDFLLTEIHKKENIVVKVVINKKNQ